jgi:hypothetical protein
MQTWKARKKETHVRKGSIQLLPGKVRQLRSFSIGAGDLESLQTYVLLLIGIKLFLRAEEVLTITLDFNFDADTQRYQIIHPGQIRMGCLTNT